MNNYINLDSLKPNAEDFLRTAFGVDTTKPFHCLNPTHKDKNPSMSYHNDKHRAHCFACGESYDLFDLIKIYYGFSEDFEAFNKASELYGGISQIPSPVNKPTSIHKKEEATMPNYFEYFDDCHNRLDQTDYPKQRGIGQELLKKFHIGYDPAFNKKGQGIKTALIIPTGPNSYIARNTDNSANSGERYCKSPGPATFFNCDVIKTAEAPIFITEGEFDALSIMMVGGEAISLGSVANIKGFVSFCKTKMPVQPLLIALDNDDAGKSGSQKLFESLQSLGINCQVVNICGSFKDPNEALLKAEAPFRTSVDNAVSEANNYYKAGKEDSSSQMPDNLLYIDCDEENAEEPLFNLYDKTLCTEQNIGACQKAVEESCEPKEAEKSPEARELEEYNSLSCSAQSKKVLDAALATKVVPCISTGFTNLDYILQGGLYEGFYIIGAVSSLGKTTFIHQICDSIAKDGQDVLFFSLEMTQSELIAKSFSRTSFFDSYSKYGNYDYAATSNEAQYRLGSGNMAPGKVNHIIESANNYMKNSKCLFIKEYSKDGGAKQLREDIENHVSLRKKAPVVVVDYLQILGGDSNASDKQIVDMNVVELKRISRDFHIPVIAISSLNRANYSGPISMSAYKESGNIEYSADILLGLQFSGVACANFDFEKAKSRNPREIDLQILKSRTGPSGGKVQFEYYAPYNTFKEVSIG